MSLRVDAAEIALPGETEGETLSRLLFDIGGFIKGRPSPVLDAYENCDPKLTPVSTSWAIHPEEVSAPTILHPSPPAARRVIVTRRHGFERMERLPTLGGDGGMIAMPDYTDHESEDWLPEGVDLKTFANNLAKLDPYVVSVRPADPRP